MNSCLIEIKFKFVGINDSYMSARVKYNNDIVEINNRDGIGIYSESIMLPSTLELYFSGKTVGTDTTVDSNGTILVDKHILIESICLDRIPVDTLFLVKRLRLVTDGNTIINSNYIGFNGIMSLPLDKNNTFNQILYCKKLGEI